MTKPLFNTSIFLLLLCIGQLPVLAQYTGGNGNGFYTTVQNNSTLFFIDSLYNGGNGNGFIAAPVTNNNLTITDSLYNGGSGNGFCGTIITNINLYLIDSLYNGGGGRGETQFTALFVSLTICGDTLFWNGNQNFSWDNASNWDCGTVPGINSTVIIDAGKPRYPVVNINTAIKKLDIRPGASVLVLSGKTLLINGL